MYSYSFSVFKFVYICRNGVEKGEGGIDTSSCVYRCGQGWCLDEAGDIDRFYHFRLGETQGVGWRDAPFLLL